MINHILKKYKKVNKIITSMLCAVLCMGMLSACGEGTKVVFTTGLSKNEVFRVGDETCTVTELMVYLTNIQNQYENVYGVEVWNVSSEGVTLEENVKEIVLAKIAQIKTMYLLALEREVTLTESEKRNVTAAAEEYFESLNEKEIELMGVDLAVIEQLYEEYALSEKVYRHIIQDVNPEISDDEARTITVQHIFRACYTRDGAGNRVEYSADKKQRVYEEMLQVRSMAVSSEHDFMDLAVQYSEDTVITHSFGKGEADLTYEEAAFSLATDEVSKVITAADGYYIIKCLNTFDREQTDLNKVEIVEERRREVFGQQYDAFVETLVRQLNTDLWEKTELLRDEEVTTADFFDVYNRHFAAE